MPIEEGKVATSATQVMALPTEDQLMKNLSTEELLKDISSLSEEKKLQAAAYIRSLKNHEETIVSPFDKDRVARRREVLKQMKKLSVEIGKHWSEDIDAAELVSSMRR